MWKLEKTDDKKYPYLITIEKSEKTNLKLLVQKKWPSDDESVFCVRHDAKPDINAIELVEEDEISSVRWLEDQTKVSIKLNRTTNQQCEFRFVTKKYKNKPGDYEQIFFKSKPDDKGASIWRVEETSSDKFPYRVSIIEKGNPTLSLLTQDKWPGASGNIFCIRANEKPEIISGKVIEEVPVVFVKRVGKRLSIMLDRSVKKRCEFLFLRKKYKTKEGYYEQIFFRTQQGINQHRTRGNLSLQPKLADLEVVIDSNERYPWKFGEHNITRQNLSVGDYALMLDNEIEAIVERKTFDNMLSDIAKIQVLHQQLTELSTYRHAAVVIEAQYGDFLSSDKIGKYSSPAHMGRALAELSVLHPNLPIIYAGNRKEANHWSLRFFEAVLKKHNDPTNDAIATAVAKTRTTKSTPLWLKVKKAILQEMPNEFTFADLKNHLSDLTDQQIRSQLYKLRDDNIVKSEGKARAVKWLKIQ
ncbi:ERCC4 domain-containing protein [Cysteiniphilum sp. SYW-8]|nr:ERCC4 domain-containing protein [Cysteiniphilum sp. SYW-8]